MTTERRRRRSSRQHEALHLFFETIAHRHGFEAVALTTDDGHLIAGASAAGDGLDVEWMGSVGASKQRAELDWDDRRLYVRRLRVNDVHLVLTSAGRAPGQALDEDIRRILG